ncbi:MAG: hypothetical protein F4X16_05500 [Caldilineaceae bacterium SB0661_bin_34]|nr:hypothetical protein [Caldilineaceae bacterium SB0661_bin_34]
MLALLALAVISGGSLAAGDLFDDGYKDCPHKTRLRDGQIDDLSVSRDSEEADEVNISWTATDPTTWGLGSNAFRTSLVVILDDDDGDPVTKTLSLGARSTTFDEVDTGTEVTVEIAIVVDTADGDYLISDIIRKSINQSLTKPAFSSGWNRITGTADVTANVAATSSTHGWQLATAPIAAGKMYYVGYNANFSNIKSEDSRLLTNPTTARLRIGLAHQVETDGQRDDVDFDAYIIRITDEDGDVVSEGDDVPTAESEYGVARIQYDNDATTDTPEDIEAFDNVLVVTGIFGADADSNPFDADTGLITTADNYALSNVRIVNGDISPAMHNVTFGAARTAAGGTLDAPTDGLSWTGVRHLTGGTAPTTAGEPRTGTPAPIIGVVYAMPPDEHRDFPVDTLSSDTTYTITAWAINDDDEVISPTASLEVRPHDTDQSTSAATFTYFRNDPGGGATATIDASTTAFSYITTAFTVHE